MKNILLKKKNLSNVFRVVKIKNFDFQKFRDEERKKEKKDTERMILQFKKSDSINRLGRLTK